MIKSCRTLLAAGILAAIGLAAPAAVADDVLYGETLVNTLYSEDDVAIRGYDTVAYHTKGKPVKGDEHYSVEYNGATWLFASAHNRDLFAKEPAKYAPAYGGYCAFGAGNGYLVKTEPEAFTVVNGTLYLNYNVGVSEKFQADIANRIKLAEQQWPGLKANLKK